jgi:hypothetical protein
MARVDTICIPTPPGSSHITVGMHLECKAPIDVLNWGQPIGEDWNVSSVNTIQVPKRKIIGMY